LDDASSKPVSFLHPHPKVRIIRSRLHCFPFSVAETRQGLIRARILGGNAGRGDNLAFIAEDEGFELIDYNPHDNAHVR